MIIKSNIPILNLSKTTYVSIKGKERNDSYTEKIIASTLRKLNIKFIQEVSFKGFGCLAMPYRFDFYIPNKRMIIEYDGSTHTTNKKVKERDEIKNYFCRINKINLVRFNKKHYSHLEGFVKKLFQKPSERKLTLISSKIKEVK